MTQVARPEADAFYPISGIDNWQNENGEQDQALFESINTFLPNDLTYAESDLLTGPDLPEYSKVYVTKLSVVPNPEMASEGLTIRVRLSKDLGGGSELDENGDPVEVEDSFFMNALVELREEYNNEITDLGILIASKTFEKITKEFTEYSFQATPAQAVNILDFDALYLRIQFSIVSGN
jgi:hypothetical protein